MNDQHFFFTQITNKFTLKTNNIKVKTLYNLNVQLRLTNHENHYLYR